MRPILLLQGVYYLITGIWPLVSLSTFEAVTGPKTDDWLVQTVGVLAAVIGATLIVESRARPLHPQSVILSALGAIGFAAVDTIFVVQGTISPIYLVDAVIQVIVLTGLLSVRVLAGQPRDNRNV